MNTEIRKTVGGKSLENPLKRVYALNQFIKSLKKEIKNEPNIKPIRKTVGRSR